MMTCFLYILLEQLDLLVVMDMYDAITGEEDSAFNQFSGILSVEDASFNLLPDMAFRYNLYNSGSLGI